MKRQDRLGKGRLAVSRERLRILGNGELANIGGGGGAGTTGTNGCPIIVATLGCTAGTAF